MSCSTCNDLIANSDSIQCYGFCGRKFHFACISKDNGDYKKSVIGFLQKIANFQWYCNECIPFTINGIFSGILAIIQENVQSLKLLNSQIHGHSSQFQLNAHANSFVSQINSNSIPINTNTNQNSIAHSTDTINNTQSTSTPPNDVDMEGETEGDDDGNSNSNSNKRRRTEDDIANQHDTRNVNTLSLADLAIDLTRESPVLDTNSQPNTSNQLNLRDIHLTNFKPNAQESDVLKFLSGYDFLVPHIASFKCKKLVRRGTRVENYSFLSFKLSVPVECFRFVIEQVQWPKSITAKEFVNRKSPALKQTQSKPISNRVPAKIATNKVNFANQIANKTQPIRNQVNVRSNNNANSVRSNQKNSMRRTPAKKTSQWQARSTSKQRPTNQSMSQPQFQPINPLYQLLLGQMLQPIFNQNQM